MTMRLINADEFEVISWRAQGGREYASGFDDGVDYVVKKIDNAPTIDAIPVEWLREFDLYYAGISGGSPYLKALIEAWQKEQEEQDG